MRFFPFGAALEFAALATSQVLGARFWVLGAWFQAPGRVGRFETCPYRCLVGGSGNAPSLCLSPGGGEIGGDCVSRRGGEIGIEVLGTGFQVLGRVGRFETWPCGCLVGGSGNAPSLCLSPGGGEIGGDCVSRRGGEIGGDCVSRRGGEIGIEVLGAGFQVLGRVGRFQTCPYRFAVGGRTRCGGRRGVMGRLETCPYRCMVSGREIGDGLNGHGVQLGEAGELFEVLKVSGRFLPGVAGRIGMSSSGCGSWSHWWSQRLVLRGALSRRTGPYFSGN